MAFLRRSRFSNLEWLARVLVLHIFVGCMPLLSAAKLSAFTDSDSPTSSQSPWRMHTLFYAECNPYFDWQTVSLMHSFRKARQPGPITRLLSCSEEDLEDYKNLDIAPTHVVPSLAIPRFRDSYSAVGMPAGILHWLTQTEAAQNVDWVVVLDVDVVLRRPLIPWELGAQKSKPVAPYDGYLVDCNSTGVLALVRTRHPEFCNKVGGFVVHHVDDLRDLAPLWLLKIEEVLTGKQYYADEGAGEIYEHGRAAEMYGYAYAASQLGLRHQFMNGVMIHPGHSPNRVDPLIIHYSAGFSVVSWQFSKSKSWKAGMLEDCNGLFPPPPYPAEVESTADDTWHTHSLSIECINTINEGLILYHVERGCPEPAKTEYLDFLLEGSVFKNLYVKLFQDHESIISNQDTGNPILSTEQKDDDYILPLAVGYKVARQLLQNPKIHTLFSTECSDYFDWQTLGLYHSFQLSGQPGFITRLLSCTEENLKTYKNMDLAPTHVVPSYSVHPLTGDKYPAINKPAAVYHWLNHVQMDVEYVVILDADMILRGPITPTEFGASRGYPVSASYEYLIGCDNELAHLHTRYPEYCQKVGGIIIMHIDDLRLLAPLWLHKTEEVRADTGHWATNLTGDVYGHGWISEMYGYAFAAAELRLRHTINNDMMLYPGYIPADGVEPRVLHYGLGFSIGNWTWDKHTWHFSDMTSTCWTLFPAPPVPDRQTYSSRYDYKRDELNFECMKTLNEAFFLYHKRKGCKQEEVKDRILESVQETRTRNDELHEKGDDTEIGDSKLSAQGTVLGDDTGGDKLKTGIMADKLPAGKSMVNLKGGWMSGNLQLFIFGVGISFAVLSLLVAVVTSSYSRRHVQTRKERIV